MRVSCAILIAARAVIRKSKREEQEAAEEAEASEADHKGQEEKLPADQQQKQQWKQKGGEQAKPQQQPQQLLLGRKRWFSDEDPEPHFTDLVKIGEGSSGLVYLATQISTGNKARNSIIIYFGYFSIILVILFKINIIEFLLFLFLTIIIYLLSAA